MKIIRPVDITDGVLVSSNVPEDDYPEWSAGTLNKGDRRIIAAEHKIYEVVAETTTDSPLDGIVADPPTWIEIGYTNRWLMFDDKVGTRTKYPEEIVVELLSGSVINALSLFELAGDSVTVTMTDPVEGEVYSKTVMLTDNSMITDWYAYFFSPIERRSDLVLFDLPVYGAATLTITINAPDGTAEAGMVVIGNQLEIGQTEYGASFGITDYSRKEFDAFGNAVVVRRAFSKRANVIVAIPTSQVDLVHRSLSEIRATPTVWVAEESFQSSIIFGFFRDFDVVIASPSISECSIEIEGLI